jgi:hypothetical protein
MNMKARSITVLFLITAAIITFALFMPRKNLAAAPVRGDVVVELFTSEGCSSCPPADKLLTELEKWKSPAGTGVIVLSEHVDYWDHQGWKDPFSSHQFTRRQEDYADRFHIDSAYTPQVVVGGIAQFVGTDAAHVKSTVDILGRAEMAPIEISISQAQVTVQASGGKGNDVIMALTESGLTNSVRGGENDGRTLAHTGVVRRMIHLGKIPVDGKLTTSQDLALDPTWKRANMAVVVFVQQTGMKQILSAARVPLS